MDQVLVPKTWKRVSASKQPGLEFKQTGQSPPNNSQSGKSGGDKTLKVETEK